MKEITTQPKFKLLAGPCVIESQDNVMHLAESLRDIAAKFDLDFYFKASWDKANRTKATNYRGPGLDEGLRILQKAKSELGVTCFTPPLQQAAPSTSRRRSFPAPRRWPTL